MPIYQAIVLAIVQGLGEFIPVSSSGHLIIIRRLLGWNELSANDGPSAWSFYSTLFGWTEDSVMDMGPMGIYRIFSTGGPRVGGMMTRDPKTAPQPFWLYYFNVDDIDAAVERIKEKNGQLVMGPHEVPGSMWIVVGVDPQGANFALVGFKKQ